MMEKELTRIELSDQDVSLVESRKAQVAAIARLFDLPISLVGDLANILDDDEGAALS